MDYLSLLFWLKWKVLFRGYQRNKMALAGAITGILFIIPIALVIAGWTLLAYTTQPSPWPAHLLRAVLLGIYFFWIWTPLAGFALNDTYDISRLFSYPLTARQIYTGVILSSVLDFPVLFLLPTLLVVFIAFTKSVAAFVLILLTTGLLVFHIFSVNQAIIMVSVSFLRSRRFRDVMMVLTPLIGMLVYLLYLWLPRYASRHDLWQFVHSSAWDVLSYLPPGIAARAIDCAARGEFVIALGLLLLLLGITVGTVYLGARLIETAYAGEFSASPHQHAAPTGVARRTPTPAATSTTARRHLPPVVEAIIDKEIKYLQRDPSFKTVLMNLLYMLAIYCFALFGSSSHRAYHDAVPMLWIGAGMLMLSEVRLPFNTFGIEGSAAATLFLFPGSRRQILIGKNVVMLLILATFNLVILTLICGLLRAFTTLPLLWCWTVLGSIILIAVGNPVSVRFPFPIIWRGRRVWQQSAGQGCGYGCLLYPLLTLLTIILLLPTVAALVIPLYWVGAGWLSLAIPCAFAYVFALYLLSLAISEPLLLKREVEIADALGQE